LKSGKVKVLRKVDFRIPDQSSQHQNVQWLSSDPTEDDFLLQLVESKLLEVDELHNGDFFGDDCVILKRQMKHSLVTAMPTEILTLDAHDFL
jgi:CRP-like cAMP-binding protein